MTLMGYDTKASDLFVAALENEGVTHIFALPGKVSAPAFSSRIQQILWSNGRLSVSACRPPADLQTDCVRDPNMLGHQR